MPGGRRPELVALGATLALDAIAGRLVRELREEGIRALVLKGPSIARLVYGDAAHRTHDDIDLLVAPADLAPTGDALRARGFAPAAASANAQAWIRRDDGVTADIHTSIVGIGASAEAVWGAFAAAPATLRLGGEDVEILAPPALALHIALHAAQHGVEAGKALLDLTLALERLEESVWREAAELAARLDALPAFAAGLRLVPAGAELAAQLDLPRSSRADVLLRARSAPITALGVQRLAATRGVGNKLRLVAREVAPSAAFMRAVYPLARRGPLGLAATYAWRPLWLLWHAGPAVRAVRRARRESRRAG